MLLPIGATVRCRDGAVTHLIVERGMLLRHDIVVPAAWVEQSSEHEIVLNATADELNALPEYNKVVYGTADEVSALVGAHTAYVERTNLTSRQMNGRLVRKTLSFSKQRALFEAACAWEDWIVGLDPLGQDLADGGDGWAAALAAALTGHDRRTNRPYLDC
jgi:hypothetical protein